MAGAGDGLLAYYKIRTEILQDCIVHTFPDPDPLRRRRRAQITKRWRRIEKIGQGGYGTVYLEEEATAKELRALKRINKSMNQNDDHNNLRELLSMAAISKDNTNFPTFFGWFEDVDHIFISMQYFPLKDLHEQLTKVGSPVPESEAQSICFQIAEALEAIHEQGITHRDLKPSNVFVEKNAPDWWVKLGDFGISKRDNTSMHTFYHGAFVAPEVFGFRSMELGESNLYTSAVDIWSLGCVAYWLMTLKTPFSVDSLREYCFAQDSSKPAFDKSPLSSDALDFISSCFELAAAARPSASGALDMAWLTLDDEEKGLQTVVEATKSTQNLHLKDESAPSSSNTVATAGLKGGSHGKSIHLNSTVTTLDRPSETLVSNESSLIWSARAREIVRRCKKLNPPIHVKQLAELEAFKQQRFIFKPLTDVAWSSLKPQLLAEAEAELNGAMKQPNAPHLGIRADKSPASAVASADTDLQAPIVRPIKKFPFLYEPFSQPMGLDTSKLSSAQRERLNSKLKRFHAAEESSLNLRYNPDKSDLLGVNKELPDSKKDLDSDAPSTSTTNEVGFPWGSSTSTENITFGSTDSPTYIAGRRYAFLEVQAVYSGNVANAKANVDTHWFALPKSVDSDGNKATLSVKKGENVIVYADRGRETVYGRVQGKAVEIPRMHLELLHVRTWTSGLKGSFYKLQPATDATLESWVYIKLADGTLKKVLLKTLNADDIRYINCWTRAGHRELVKWGALSLQTLGVVQSKKGLYLNISAALWGFHRFVSYHDGYVDLVIPDGNYTPVTLPVEWVPALFIEAVQEDFNKTPELQLHHFLFPDCPMPEDEKRAEFGQPFATRTYRIGTDAPPNSAPENHVIDGFSLTTFRRHYEGEPYDFRLSERASVNLMFVVAAVANLIRTLREYQQSLNVYGLSDLAIKIRDDTLEDPDAPLLNVIDVVGTTATLAADGRIEHRHIDTFSNSMVRDLEAKTRAPGLASRICKSPFRKWDLAKLRELHNNPSPRQKRP